MKNLSTAGKNTSTVANIAYGVLLSLSVSFLLSMLVAVIIEKEIAGISWMHYWVIGIHVLSVFVGTMLSMTLEKGRLAIVDGIVAACYFLILMCANMLIFTDGFSGLGAGILGIISGGMISLFVKSKISSPKKHHIKMHSR